MKTVDDEDFRERIVRLTRHSLISTPGKAAYKALVAHIDCLVNAAEGNGPTPKVLWCPNCHVQHIDAGEWTTRPHKTHLCQHCMHLWRPFEYPTVGVLEVAPPKRDYWKDLRKLCGYLQNGSDVTVKLSQDDACHTYHLYVGKTMYWGNSFEECVDKAMVEYKED